MMKIITAPNPILRKKAVPVVRFDEPLKKLIDELQETLEKALIPETGYSSVGLAAPQAGISQRIILAKKVKKRGITGETVVLVNPEIFKASSQQELGLEGCLSIPNTYGNVKRARWIKVKAQGEKGQKREFKAEGFYARILQHEIDHLDGVLFTDKAVGRLYTARELDRLPTE